MSPSGSNLNFDAFCRINADRLTGERSLPIANTGYELSRIKVEAGFRDPDNVSSFAVSLFLSLSSLHR